MKRGVPLIILLGFLLVSAPVVFGAERDTQVTGETGPCKEVLLTRPSYALVVGNGDYRRGWAPLPGALEDVEEVAQVLKTKGFMVNLKKDLTKAGFSRTLREFAERYGKDETNQLLFYYAGHGYRRKIDRGEESGCLVMVDAPHPSKDPVGFEAAAVDVQALLAQAGLVEARHVMFMFDSCFSGAILDLRDGPPSGAVFDKAEHPVRQCITAGRGNETVPDCSIFRQAFLNVLEGREPEPIPDGYLTGEELGRYLGDKVPAYNPMQHPQYGKTCNRDVDDGDFVFVLGRGGMDGSAGRGALKVCLGGIQRGFELVKPGAKGELKVDSEPPGAQVYLDGKDVGQTPIILSDLLPGKHAIRVVREGYEPHELQVQVAAGARKTVLAYLESAPGGGLLAKSKPKGAEVYVDGKSVGTSPVRRTGLSVGSHTVRITKEGYEPWERKVTVKAGETIQILGRLKEKASPTAKKESRSFLSRLKEKITAPVSAVGKKLSGSKAEKGDLVAKSEPSGAKVYVDGKSVGTSPVERKVSPGTHRVRMVKEGYRPWEHDVTVKAGETSEATARLPQEVSATVSVPVKRSGKRYLVPSAGKESKGFLGRLKDKITAPVSAVAKRLSGSKAEKGGLVAKSEPSGAEVYVDGKSLGASPVEHKDLSPGMHRVRMVKQGYKPWEGDVTIRAGEKVETKACLKH